MSGKIDQPANDGPTEASVAWIAELVRDFRSNGGTIHLPPHQPSDLGRWRMEAVEYVAAYDALPPAAKTLRLRAGLLYMWGALMHANCIVAVAGGRLAAALSYSATGTHLQTGTVGSRQRQTVTRGAGHAIEFALVAEAVAHGVGIKGTYTPDSRSWHERLGRRLDKDASDSTEWTAEDCAFILKEVEERLD